MNEEENNKITSRRTTLLFALAFVAVLAVSAIIQCWNCTRPWKNYRDANGFSQGKIASNYGRYGLTENGLAPLFDQSEQSLAPIFRIKYSGNPFFLMRDNKVLLVHYPPTLNLILYGTYRIFGESPASTRLLSVFVTMLSLVLFFLAARRFAGDSAALIGAFFLALSPMILSYGQMPDTITFCELFIMGALHQYLLWDENRRARHFAGLLLFAAAGCMTGWYFYLAVPLIVAHHIIARRGKFSKALFILLPAVAGACLAAFVAWLMWIAGPDAIRDWLSAYKLRQGDFVYINDTRYPFSTFQFLKTVVMRIPFHFTWVVFLASAVWLWGMRKRPQWRPDRRAAFGLALVAGVGLMPALIFKQGTYVHGFYLYLLGPGACLCAGMALALWLKRDRFAGGVLCAACLALFAYTAVPRYNSIVSYLSIDQAGDFAKFVDSVSGPDTVVAQDIFDFGMVLWVNIHTDRFLLQRELSMEQIKSAVSLLPKGRHLVFIHLPLPDTYRLKESENTLAWLYENYGYYEKGGFVVFDTRLKPAPQITAAGVRPQIPINLNFQENIRLIGMDIAPAGAPSNSVVIANKQLASVRAGGTVKLTYYWECLRPVRDNFIVLVSIIPGMLHNDHEPSQGMYLTSHWKAGQVIKESYEVKLPADLPAGRFPVEISLCAKKEPGQFCLQPAESWTESAPRMAKVAEIDIVQPGSAAAPDPALAEKLGDISSYMEYYDLQSYRRFIRYMSMDPVLASSFDGWDMMFRGQDDRAAPVLAKLSRRFDEFGMIEKMVPTAMQEVPVLLKTKLMMIYYEYKMPIAAAREAVSLGLNLPVSYEIYHRAGAQLDRNAAKSPNPLPMLAVSDYFFGRMLDMKPGNPNTIQTAVEHYLYTNRPEKALQAVAGRLGAELPLDLRMNALFAVWALRNGDTQDYRIMSERVAALNPPADFHGGVFRLLEDAGGGDEVAAFLDEIKDPGERDRFRADAIEGAFYRRDFKRGASLMESAGAGNSAADGGKRMGAYFALLGYAAQNARKPRDAAAYYEKALRCDPDNTDVLANLSQIYYSRGDAKGAAALLRQLLIVNPADAQARKFLEEISAPETKN